MNNYTIKYLNSRFLGIIYFLLLFVCLFLPSQRLAPSIDVLIMQILIVLISLFVIEISTRLSKNVLLLTIFIAHLFMSVAIRIFYVEYWNDPLGPIPVDSLEYHSDAIRFSKYSFCKFINLCFEDHALDDLGFTIIMYVVYRLFGNEFGIHVILFFNSIAVALMCNYTYKISNFYLRTNYSKLVIAILGTLSYSVVTSANGLKENFFTLFIVGTIYYSIKFYSKKSISYFILFVLFSFATLFFRLAFFPMLLIALLSVKIAKYIKFNAKYILVLIVIFVISLYVGIKIIAYLLTMRGLSDSIFSDMYAMQFADTGLGGVQTLIANGLFAVVGPIPSFVSTVDKISYITLPNFSSFVSIILGSFFICGIIKAVNRRDHIYIMLTTVLLNCLMVLLMSFSFNFRYRFIIMPFILLLTAYGLQKMEVKELKYHRVYMTMISLIILFYNVVF